jgi:hypothetical protein
MRIFTRSSSLAFVKAATSKGKIFFDPARRYTYRSDCLIAGPHVGQLDVTYPGAANGWTFTGVLTQYDVKAKVKDALEADITIKVSGKPTFA